MTCDPADQTHIFGWGQLSPGPRGYVYAIVTSQNSVTPSWFLIPQVKFYLYRYIKFNILAKPGLENCFEKTVFIKD